MLRLSRSFACRILHDECPGNRRFKKDSRKTDRWIEVILTLLIDYTDFIVSLSPFIRQGLINLPLLQGCFVPLIVNADNKPFSFEMVCWCHILYSEYTRLHLSRKSVSFCILIRMELKIWLIAE